MDNLMKCIGGDRIPLIIFPIFKPVISSGIKCSRCALMLIFIMHKGICGVIMGVRVVEIEVITLIAIIIPYSPPYFNVVDIYRISLAVACLRIML